LSALSVPGHVSPLACCHVFGKALRWKEQDVPAPCRQAPILFAIARIADTLQAQTAEEWIKTPPPRASDRFHPKNLKNFQEQIFPDCQFWNICFVLTTSYA